MGVSWFLASGFSPFSGVNMSQPVRNQKVIDSSVSGI